MKNEKNEKDDMRTQDNMQEQLWDKARQSEPLLSLSEVEKLISKGRPTGGNSKPGMPKYFYPLGALIIAAGISGAVYLNNNSDNTTATSVENVEERTTSATTTSSENDLETNTATDAAGNTSELINTEKSGNTPAAVTATDYPKIGFDLVNEPSEPQPATIAAAPTTTNEENRAALPDVQEPKTLKAAAGEIFPGWRLHGPHAAKFKAGKDMEEHYSGSAAAFVDSKKSENFNSAWLSQEVSAAPYAGKRVRLTAVLKCKNSGKTAWAGLFLAAQSDESRTAYFDNLFDREKVLNAWTPCSVVVDVPSDARNLSFGLYKVYGGKAWIDNVKLEVVDQSVALSGKTEAEASDTSATMQDRLLLGRNGLYGPQPANLSFEEATMGNKKPGSWALGLEKEGFKFSPDTKESHAGNTSALLQATKVKAKDWNTVMELCKPGPYLGKKIRFSAWIKTENLKGYASLWLRVDETGGAYNLDNLLDKVVRGTTGWKKYEIVMDVPHTASGMAFGLILQNNGKAWIDDIQIETLSDLPMNAATAKIRKPINLDFEN